jgi:toxin YoeB
MRVVNFSDARNRLKCVLNQVVEDSDYTVIYRRDAVVMSLEQFNALLETVHLLKSPANAAHLARSMGQDRKTLKRINQLISDTQQNPFEGVGKPESLKENLSGFWSRRIDHTNRLVYIVDDGKLTIISCRYHYEK